MKHETSFSVRYMTDDPVPIKDIIDSLQGVETILSEVGRLLPLLIDGLHVERVDVKVREISQQSPLKEMFLVALFMAFQKDLEAEVPNQISVITGYPVPDRFDTIVTVVALVVVFYGVGALKDLVIGHFGDGPAQRQLDGLILELSESTGKTAKDIKRILADRYGDRTLWKRLANATSRFFLPSKRQSSAPVEVNERVFDRPVIQDIPADYIVDNEAERNPARRFQNVILELHAQDRDNAARGWAAVLRAASDKRVRLKLMDGVSAQELWGNDVVRGDVTVIYDRIGTELVAKEIHLERVSGFN